MKSYRVRFAAKNKFQVWVQNPPSKAPSSTGSSPDESQQLSLSLPGLPRAKGKSRSGCKECKLRRVKCDETYPVCLRCQRRGSVCLSATPSTQWQVEMPWMVARPLAQPWTGTVNPEKRLLQYWLEKTSRIMTLCPDDNPLSFPLLEHLMSTPSLLHAVQSVSAGQEHFFQPSSLTVCLQERGRSIQALRHEMKDPAQVKPPSLLAVFLQGVSWSWTEHHPDNYGKEHLLAARVLLDQMLGDPEKRRDPLVRFMLGWYLYWDMSCAFIADPHDLAPLNTAQVFDAIQSTRGYFHPMVGFSAELLYLIACLGRHCRQVMEAGVKDPTLEATFEGQLLAWEPDYDDQNLVDMTIGYRNHGLMMLYSICGIPSQSNDSVTAVQGPASSPEDSGTRIRSLAMDSLRRLFKTPVDAPCFSFHSTPLLTAAAELRAEDARMRVAVVNRFKAIYSTNRVAVNMWAIELLEELWDLHDCGIHITWLELLITKKWALTFA
ncbi:fungal-specific transcription factor domain-containing protein [Dactylonectria estremocensis]|uniref:Fungal-specific transcription factor domain-containing protein n=1 Tax=Dactylonectria estremocensis TaxID=1079267 RepID=A0A9P9DTQ1_9HYPO|nr:fungal-specific transcription factor domain-containing protein [Dactylonectria estremocensis]